MAFWDIDPIAPVHLVIIPKKHIGKIMSMSQEDQPMLAKVLWTAREMAKRKRLDDGYRLVINQGLNAGQMVDHFHVHLLAGAALGAFAVISEINDY